MPGSFTEITKVKNTKRSRYPNFKVEVIGSGGEIRVESQCRDGLTIRGHWSVENKNLWKRETSLWKEDASRRPRMMPDSMMTR